MTTRQYATLRLNLPYNCTCCFTPSLFCMRAYGIRHTTIVAGTGRFGKVGQVVLTAVVQ
jgi:hypothetical protein